MGLIKNTTIELAVYLTDLGRQRLLEQGFAPVTFSISDDDVNYNGNQDVDQATSDLTGDYVDNIFSLSKNIKIKNQIIK